MRAMSNETDIQIGKRLREARLNKGFTLRGLSEALGISFQQVQQYETGSNQICGSRLWVVCSTLEIPVEFLFEGLARMNKSRSGPMLVPEEIPRSINFKLAEALNKITDDEVRSHFLQLIRDFERVG